MNADGTNVADGTYNFDFVLYDDATLGSPSDGVHDKWHELSKSVSVTAGVFQTELGSATTLPNFSSNSTLYLAMRFNGDAAGYMSPRVHFDSAPYALYSDNSGQLGGLASSQYVQLAQGVQSDGSSSNTSIAVNKTAGTANILDLQRSSASVLLVDNNGTTTLQPAGDNVSLIVKQTSTASPTADIFDVLGTNGTSKFVAVTSTAANQGSVTLQSIGGSNALTLTSAGAATWSSAAGNLTVTGGAQLILQSTGGGTNSVVVRAGNNALSLDGAGSQQIVSTFSQTAASTNSKDLSISTGGASGSSSTSGNLFISTGASAVNSGYVSIDTGTATSGTTGTIYLGVNYASTIALGRSSGANTTNTFTGTSIFKPLTDSSNLFEIQRANGSPLLLVDSTTNNLINNPGFEVNTTGWSARGSASISQNLTTSNTYHGLASLQVVTGAVANNGTSTNSFTQTVAAGTYTLSFYAKLSSGVLTTIRAGYNQGAGDVACTLNNNTLVTGGFQRYNCTFTTSANMSTIWIDQGTNTTSVTIYLDAIQLESGSNVTPYKIGGIQLRGTINNPLSFKGLSDSTTAIQVQNAAGTANTLVVDTLNTRLGIGTASPSQRLDVQGGDINTSGVYRSGGTAGINLGACTASQYFGAARSIGGIITAGTCTNDATGISDARLKTNVQALGSMLDKLKDLDVVSFLFNRDQFPDMNLDEGTQYGVIAQEIQSLFPELVSTGDDGYLRVNYKGLSIYNLKAVTELAKLIDSQGNAKLNTVQGNTATFADLNVGGLTELNNVVVQGTATFEGNIIVQGHIVGNPDTRGEVAIPIGQSSFRHDFDKPFDVKPVVVASPVGQDNYASYTIDADATGFTIYLKTPATVETKFDYLVQQ